jgi:hypothetical protein
VKDGRQVQELWRAQRSAIAASGLEARALEVLTAGVKGTRALEAVRGEVGTLVISGGVGAGKTIAASWWLRAFIADESNWNWEIGPTPALKGEPVFIRAFDLAFWSLGDRRETVRLRNAARLVVDDLGQEVPVCSCGGCCFKRFLEDLVSERHTERRPTVITTSLTASEFRERYGYYGYGLTGVPFARIAGKSLRKPGGAS